MKEYSSMLLITFVILQFVDSYNIPIVVNQPLYISSSDPYEVGELSVSNLTISGSIVNPNVTNLMAFYPEEEGLYATNIFLTAFDGDILVGSYSEVLGNISGHGFIVIGITTFPLFPTDITTDIQKTIDWIISNLQNYLPPGVKADFENLSLMGHSAGGKVMTEVVMKGCGQVGALVLLDPVDGNPFIISQNVPVNFTIPTFFLGTGLGNSSTQDHYPPCAPNVADFHHFYQAFPCPKLKVNATHYGHLDMLNEEDEKKWEPFCVSGHKYGADLSIFRHYTWGSVSSFLMGIFQRDCSSMYEIMKPPIDIELIGESDMICSECPTPSCKNY